ncbi:MAG: hypothetical protein R3C18_23420 [Planctomycetaceae bacterium]
MFGSRRFHPLGASQPVALEPGTQPPLVIIRTNGERTLPDAFVRRCLSLHLELPDLLEPGTEPAFVKFLVERGQHHFPAASTELLTDAAKLLCQDRRYAAEQQHRPLPGQAEYLDFVRAIAVRQQLGDDPQEVFEKIHRFVFKKSHGANQ